MAKTKPYFSNWESGEEILRDFDVSGSALDGAQIIYAAYEGGSYEGRAFVLFEKDGKLFEVNGSHCSCNGLEGQWDPEETTWRFLATRKDIISKYDYSEGSIETLKTLIKENNEN